jgi:hypothetical protein
MTDDKKPDVATDRDAPLTPRSASLVPPRDRPTPRRPSEPPPTAGEVVEIVHRVIETNLVEAIVERVIDEKVAPLRTKIDDLHALLMGAPATGVHPLVKRKDGREGGIGTAFHDLNDHLTGIKGTGDAVYERLSKIYELLTADVLQVHQEHTVLLGKVDNHDHRIAILEEKSPPSSNGKHHGEQT